MTPSAEQGREVRQRLLAAAVELVPERGWSAVSTRLVADRARVSPSVVHYHFASMTALLHEAVLTTMRQLLAEVDAVMEQATTAGEVVDLLVGSLDEYSGADPMSLLFVEAYLASTRDEELRGELVRVVDELRSRLAGWLAERGVPQPVKTASVLAASIDGILLHRGLGAGPPAAVVAEVMRRLVTVSASDAGVERR